MCVCVCVCVCVCTTHGCTYLVKEGVVGALPGAGLLDGAATDNLHHRVQLTPQQLAGLQNMHPHLHGVGVCVCERVRERATMCMCVHMRECG